MISNRQRRFIVNDANRRLHRWLKVHDDSFPLKHYHYSAVIQNGTILAAATNRRLRIVIDTVKTSKLKAFDKSATIHSEIAVLSKSRPYIITSERFLVVNVRISTKTGCILDSTPCCECSQVLHNHNCECISLTESSYIRHLI